MLDLSRIITLADRKRNADSMLIPNHEKSSNSAMVIMVRFSWMRGLEVCHGKGG